MFISMTGFGRAVKSAEGGDVGVEIRALNSKFCDISVHLPKILSHLETPLRTLAQGRLLRGKADITVSANFSKPPQTPVLNRAKFVSALNVLEQMKTSGGLSDTVTLSHLLSFGDLIEYDLNPNLGNMEGVIKECVWECLAEVERMRRVEGDNLRHAVDRCLSELEGLVAEVDRAKEGVFDYWLGRFKTRMAEFALQVDEARIIGEAAIYAEKADIKEEIARLYSHLKQFRHIMEEEYPCGKKLDFLCQEMNRECNTIAAKSAKSEVINIVVRAKSAVESIKEQIQNVV